METQDYAGRAGLREWLSQTEWWKADAEEELERAFIIMVLNGLLPNTALTVLEIVSGVMREEYGD